MIGSDADLAHLFGIKRPFLDPLYLSYPEDKMLEHDQFRVRLASVGKHDFGQNPLARKYGAEAKR